jgi:hypothetical protein
MRACVGEDNRTTESSVFILSWNPIVDVAESVLKTGSTSSGAMLLSAWDWFQKRSAKADDTIRNGIGIGTELAVAVDSCIETAAHEFDLQQQRRLMKAAAYGKAFLDFYSPQLFVETARTLRVLNAVRYPDIGIPLTYLQYKHQGPHILVQRLTHRHHHLLALRICEYLQLKVDDVLIHWASTKVRRSSLSDEELAAEIVKKLKPYPSISYAEIARTAYKVQRPVLAALVCLLSLSLSSPLLIHTHILSPSLMCPSVDAVS